MPQGRFVPVWLERRRLGFTLPGPLRVAGTAMGAAGYMSPEQAMGDHVDARSDVFSIGVVLYEMLSGRRPFSGASHVEVMRALLSSEPPSLRTLSANIPGALAQIVQQCLEKAPDARFSSAVELSRALRLLDRGAPPTATTQQAAPSPARKADPRQGIWIAAPAAARL